MTGKHRVRQRLVRCALICAVSLSTTGCFDRQELEEQAFVISMGIDKAPQGLVDCTLRIALPQNPSGGAAGGKTPLANSGPVTFRAHSVMEAILLANTSIERTVSLSHLNLVLFGESVAKDGLETQLQPLLHFREFRRTSFVGVCKGQAREVLMQEKPLLEQMTGRLPDSVGIVGSKAVLFPVSQLHDFVRKLQTPHESAVLPVFAVNQGVQKDPQGEQGVQGDTVKYLGGEIVRTGGNPVEWAGAGVFREDRLVDILDAAETIRLRLLQGTLNTTKVAMPDPAHAGAFVGLSLRKERDPHYMVTLGKTLSIDVNVPLDATLIHSDGTVDYTNPAARVKFEQQLNTTMGSDLTKVLQKLLHDDVADAIPISRHVRHRFAVHQQYVSYPWETQMKSAKVVVHTEIHIRRFGTQLGVTKAHL